MTRRQANEILMRYRPAVDDRSDPEIAEALTFAARDAELDRWLEQQTTFHQAASTALRGIPAPSQLKNRILADRVTVTRVWDRHGFLLAAASIAMLLSLSLWWLTPSREEHSFSAFLTRMVRFAVREYRMDIVTSDAAEVRRFLAERAAPTDYTLTRGLQALPVKGAGRLSWQGNPVAMVCFGLPKDETAYLFVMNAAAVRDGATPNRTPEITTTQRFATAAWSNGDKVYLLAAPTDTGTLKKMVE